MTTDRDQLAAALARADGWQSAAPLLSGLTTPAADRYRRLAETALAFRTDQPAAPSAPADPRQRRTRYAAAIARGKQLDFEHMAAYEQKLFSEHNREGIDAVMAVADAEQAELSRERDLAVAHDRQPYPTTWAYEQACAALRRKTDTIERVRTALAARKALGATGRSFYTAISDALNEPEDEAQQAEPATSSTPRVVAYTASGRTLHCLACTPTPRGNVWTPLTSEDLPHGGLCSDCHRDVLVPREAEEQQP